MNGSEKVSSGAGASDDDKEGDTQKDDPPESQDEDESPMEEFSTSAPAPAHPPAVDWQARMTAIEAKNNQIFEMMQRFFAPAAQQVQALPSSPHMPLHVQVGEEANTAQT